MANSEGAGKRRGLGRGLGALIVNTEDTAASDAEQQENGVRAIPIDAISPNPHQPRSQFDSRALSELADSIRAHGVIQPLIVTVAPDHADDAPHYWIVAGERRWRARLPPAN
jgi:ParB family chromosome partitioning protein